MINVKDSLKTDVLDALEIIYNRFIDAEEDSCGCLKSIRFKNADSFNFAFDVMDVLGRECGTAQAMLHLDSEQNVRNFTFREIMDMSNRAANYFVSLGIKKGDRVMLVLKRHYHFWTAILALHKIGAVAIPATSQLQVDDFKYRFDFGGISAVVCTCDDDVPAKVDKAERLSRRLDIKIAVGGEKDGWYDFDSEYALMPEIFERTENSPAGRDPMIMFFTSGTTGYPKIVEHDFRYPLGHFVTAKYWHDIRPGGIHFTVADTGWGKALWGKLYGQWLCGACVFVYDFDRFRAAEILPMFKRFNIVTFCAPPTVYRMMIKENLADYDLSSIRCATTAGEVLNPEVFYKFKEQTGINIMEGFGQTETTLIIATLRGMKPKAGSMGRPVPSYNIELLNRDGRRCEPNEIGEIVIRSSPGDMCGLFREYFKSPELTGEAWRGGVYHTCDLARMDEDGYYWYVGRCDDIIKSSGYKIGPSEVENVIMELPYVLECAVSGVPDEIRGQRIKATVVLAKGTEASETLKKDIQNYVKTMTAPYKYPREVEFVDELPKTISGKVIRSML